MKDKWKCQVMQKISFQLTTEYEPIMNIISSSIGMNLRILMILYHRDHLYYHVYSPSLKHCKDWQLVKHRS